MRNYSYTGSKEGTAFAVMDNIDASYKDLGAVCDAIRYRKAADALAELDEYAEGTKPVYYRTHNTGFGARHELGGKKGRFPMKAARIVRRVLINAIANAKNKGYELEEMAVVHAAANKMQILVRSPPKGVMFLGSGITGHTYGFSPARRSNLEYAKVEIVLASETAGKLSEKASKLVKRHEKAYSAAHKAEQAKQAKKQAGAPAIAKKKEEGKPKAMTANVTKEKSKPDEAKVAEEKQEKQGKEKNVDSAKK
ncbi:MAG: uL22 family ribosomal protein [Candidatus Micrarchaeia archaeon]